MKNKISKRLIAFLLCMVLVIGNSVSILADTPAPEKATVETQTKDASATKKEDASKKTKAGDGTENVSAQSEDSADTEKPSDEDPAPEVKTTEEKKETTEASTEKKDDSAAANEDKDDPAEVTTKAKADTDKTDETTTETTTGENNQETEPASETTTKAKEETTEATTGATTETNAENGETAAASVRKYEYKSDDVNVTVTLSDPADLPDEAELTVKPVELSKEVKEKIIKDAVGEENEELVNDINAYDITFMLDGEEVQPKAEVKVSISKLDIEEDQEAFVYHVDDNDKIEDMGGKVNKEGDVVFDTTHFSEYAVLAVQDSRLTDLDSKNITQNNYNTLLNNMKQEVEQPSATNIPITSWRRSSSGKRINQVSNNDRSNWTWSDVSGITTNVTKEEKVWDGSRAVEKEEQDWWYPWETRLYLEADHYYSANDYLKENMITVKGNELYDSATWTHDYKSGATMNRFCGEFSISDEEVLNYSYTIKPVTDDNKLYINDDIFVFVYPQGKKITEDNYMDYLAFWTGTVTQNGNTNISFHGRKATKATKGDVEGFARLTNGWYLEPVEDNAGDIITREYQENGTTDFCIDVFVDDYAAGGGMYRLKLEKQQTNRTEVKFQKVNVSDYSPISGVEFEVDRDNAHYEATSDLQGYVTFHLVPGEYTMTEDTPDGYENPNGNWTIDVKSDGTYTITWNGDSKDNNVISPSGNSETYKITNRKNGEDPDIPDTEPAMGEPEHHKYIKKNDDGTYRLSLDVTGKLGSAKPVDILLIIDSSGSIADDNLTGNINTSINTLITTLKEATVGTEADINLAAVTFDGWKTGNWQGIGQYWDKPYNDARNVSNGWKDLEDLYVYNNQNNFFYFSNSGWNSNWPSGGTNWEAGIEVGEQLLSQRADSNKYVIFLTDGTPTYRYDKDGYTIGDGNSDPGDSNYNAATTAWSESVSLRNTVERYVVDATSSKDYNSVCSSFKQYINGEILKGRNPTDMSNSFKKIADDITRPSYNSVKITDTLSKYVDFAEQNPTITVWKDKEGDYQEKEKLTESVDYTLSGNYKDGGKTITVALSGELEEDYRYWVEFNVKPTDEAYYEYSTSGYGQTIGDEGTDASDNNPATSSGKPGFHSNESAQVKYKVNNSTEQTAEYKHPVVQVDIDKTQQTVKKEWKGTKQDSVEVELTASVIVETEEGNKEQKYIDSSNCILLPENMTVILSDSSNHWTYTWNDLPTKYYYQVGGEIKSTDISYSVDEPTVPDGYDKQKVVSVDGLTTTITNQELSATVKKVWSDASTDSDKPDFHEDVLVAVYEGATVPANQQPDDILVLNAENNWERDFSLASGEEDYVIRELKEDMQGTIEYDGNTYSIVDNNAIGLFGDYDYKVSYSGDVQNGYTVTNTRLNTITIHKQDNDKNPLAGATFKMERLDEDGNPIGTAQSITTEADGTITFTDLADGKYRITETQSPAGHSLLANPIEVELPLVLEEGESSDNTGTAAGVVKGNETYYYDLTYTVINNKLFTMPEAGGRNIFLLTLAGTAMIALAGGSTIYYRRRRGVHNRRGR